MFQLIQVGLLKYKSKNKMSSLECAYCGKEAFRIVNGKKSRTVWCNIKCQNLWIDSYQVTSPEKANNKQNNGN